MKIDFIAIISIFRALLLGLFQALVANLREDVFFEVLELSPKFEEVVHPDTIASSDWLATSKTVRELGYLVFYFLFFAFDSQSIQK